jgi:NAD-dependent dihydropyrimidine dehydrogenase PreA subunit
MPGMFIDVKVDAVVAADVELAKKLVEVCPVSIFAQENGDTLRIVEENLDECVLCDLCIEAAPKGSVQVIRLYDSEE